MSRAEEFYSGLGENIQYGKVSASQLNNASNHFYTASLHHGEYLRHTKMSNEAADAGDLKRMSDHSSIAWHNTGAAREQGRQAYRAISAANRVGSFNIGAQHLANNHQNAVWQ